MPARRSSRTSWFVGAAVLFAVGLGALALARSRGDSSAAPSPSPSASDSASVEAAVAAASATLAANSDPGERTGVLAKTSLQEAIDAAKPKMANTNGRLDEGSALLALWASKNLGWNGLQSLIETTPSLFRKDPEAERGKRLCVFGTISEIRAEKTLATRLAEDRALPLIRDARSSGAIGAAGYVEAPVAPGTEGAPLPTTVESSPAGPDPWAIPDDGKVFFATITTKPPEASTDSKGHAANFHPLLVEVIAVKSTGTLVDGGEIRACGILTGVTMPAGSTSADSMEHRIVGLFDLPENH